MAQGGADVIAPYNRELKQPPARDARGAARVIGKAYDLRAGGAGKKRGAGRQMPQRGPN